MSAKTPEINIFLVEDNPLYSKVIETKLNEYDQFNVRVFETGEACFAKLGDFPDVVVMDYNLPGIDGLETFRRIKEIIPKIKVIFLSGERNAELSALCENEGAIEFLIKERGTPVTLYNKIRHLMAQEPKKEVKNGFFDRFMMRVRYFLFFYKRVELEEKAS